MIEGVRGGILKTMLRSPAVPTFPNGGGAVFHGKQPRGIVIGQNQLPSEVGTADLRQRGTDETNTDEPGGQVAVLFNVFGQTPRGVGPEVFGQELELEREDVSRLGIALDAAVGGNE